MGSYAFTDAYIYTGITADDGVANEVAQYANAATLETTVDVLDDTKFQATAHSRKGGLTDAEITADLLFDDAAAAADFAGSSVGTRQPLSIMDEGNAAGNIAWGFRGLVTDYGAGGTVGDLAMVPFTASGASKIFRGITLGSVTDTVTGTSAATQHVATAGDDTDKLYATLHVITMTATTLDVVLQSDTSGFPSATSRITFAQVSAADSEFAQEATDPTGGADDYYRTSYTVGGAGTVTFIVSLGIRST